MRYFILASSLLLVAACNRSNGNSEERQPDVSAAKTDPAQPVAADNTKVNERDREPSALTPTDQGGSEADRNITQRVRQLIVKQESLSTTAKNVKIITQNGAVTLRGPVKSAEERVEIGRMTQGTEGVTTVDNQLEVASQ